MDVGQPFYMTPMAVLDLVVFLSLVYDIHWAYPKISQQRCVFSALEEHHHVSSHVLHPMNSSRAPAQILGKVECYRTEAAEAAAVLRLARCYPKAHCFIVSHSDPFSAVM